MWVRVCNAVLTACLIFALACLFERRAYAYIDPGSGILACQAISAFFTGTIFYFRRRIRNLFRPARPSGADDKVLVNRSET